MRIDAWGVKWVETHNYGKSHQYGIAVASRAGTYGFCKIECDDAFVEYVQHGSVPVLQYCQVCHNLGCFSGWRTAMNNANTVG